MAELEIPIETISQTLGHSLPGSAMTAVYVKFNNNKVDDAMAKVIAYLNDKSVSLHNERGLSIRPVLVMSHTG